MTPAHLKKNSLNSDLLLAELKRLQRLYSYDALPEKIAMYVLERYYPKVGPGAGPRIRRLVGKERVWAVSLKFYKIEKKYVLGSRRFGEYAKARRAVMYLLLMRTPLTVTQIGRIFNRHHSTVCHNKKRLIAIMDRDEDTRREIEQLNKLL